MNNILLLFFALPVAITILSIIAETLIHSPIKVAGITFSILLLITFTVADENFLIFTIIYTILSYIVAWITNQWLNNQNDDNCLNQLIQTTNTESLLNANNNINNSINQINNGQSQNLGCGYRRRN